MIGQPYFLAPILLLALLHLSKSPTFGRLLLAAAAQGMLLTVTIFPPMILMTLIDIRII